ncbi:hypothetical protein [Nocardia panacis]|nr:hypothetical protein [Nocardia panacis]
MVELVGQPERSARDAALAAMAVRLDDLGVRQLWIESCGQDRRDREVLRNALDSASGSGFPYRHTGGGDEPLLWLPDVIAWAYGKGGQFRREVKDMVTVREVR